MKNKIFNKFALVLLVCFSLFCFSYLQVQKKGYSQQTSFSEVVDASIKEGKYIPDVKIVKEILKSIFNVVKT